MLDRADIEARLPHGPPMCLLDSVLRWDTSTIHGVARAADAMHPLAREGFVPAVAAVEYAAQAVAVHGALLAGRGLPRPGMLAKIGEATLHADRIPVGEGPIGVHAALLGAGPSGCLYHVEVRCGDRPVASGRLMVAFASGVDS
jgi:predicted hotdog family 3-hydroxylacyl-ACP dehydratase